MIVDAGLNAIRNLMASGAIGTAPTHIELGSQAYTPLASEGSLTGSFFRATFTSNTVANKTNKYEYLLPSTEANGTTLRGMAIFNAAESGDMFATSQFTALSKDATIEVQFNVDFKYVDS